MRVLLLSVMLLLAACSSSSKQEEHIVEDHSHHQHHQLPKDYQKLKKEIAIPSFTFVNQKGEMVSSEEVFNSSKTTFVQFIFTSCPTICPVMSTHFASFQKQVGEEVQFVSISIDPNYDTPQKLLDYSKNFNSKDNWIFLTGNNKEIIALQKAFDSYYGNKMYHQPSTFLKRPNQKEWVVYEGFINGKQLLAEFQEKQETI